jgi:hypothetical protein
MPGNPRELITRAERRFPVRIRIALPPEGLDRLRGWNTSQNAPEVTKLAMLCGDNDGKHH